MELSVIVAITNDHIIGSEWTQDSVAYNELPHSVLDKQHFSLVTQYTPNFGQNLLVVGRKTWETLPDVMRNCKHRRYIVLTRQETCKLNPKNICPIVLHDFQSALQYCLDNQDSYYKIFIIGGAEVYKLAMDSGFVTEIYLSRYCTDILTENIADCRLASYELDTNKFKLQSYKKITDKFSFKLNNDIKVER